MQHFTQVIDGIDGSRAELVGYVIDNTPGDGPGPAPAGDPDHFPAAGTLSGPTVNPNRSRCNSSRPAIRRSY